MIARRADVVQTASSVQIHRRRRIHYTWSHELKPHRAVCSVLASSRSCSDSCLLVWESGNHFSSDIVQVQSICSQAVCSKPAFAVSRACLLITLRFGNNVLHLSYLVRISYTAVDMIILDALALYLIFAVFGLFKYTLRVHFRGFSCG